MLIAQERIIGNKIRIKYTIHLGKILLFNSYLMRDTVVRIRVYPPQSYNYSRLGGSTIFKAGHTSTKLTIGFS
jgi:hypothetical protein